MESPTFLIVGATGQQGSAVLSALSSLTASTPSSTSARPKVLALTRSPASTKAQGLASQYPGLDLHVVEGDLRAPGPVFAAHPGISSVFLYGIPPDEAGQVIPFVDAAAAAGVRHVVYSSVDRGGDAASWDRATDVPHFAQKHAVEVYLRGKVDAAAAAAGGGVGSGEEGAGKGAQLRYTILRPTAFFDNLNPSSVFGPIFASMWGTMPADKPLQLVSIRDVGVFGARALLEPEKWEGRAVGLAGQEMTLSEAKEVFQRVAGKELPQSYWIVAKGLRWGIGDVGKMFQFFEETGYAADIGKLRKEDPELQDFEKWLKESSKFELSSS